MKKVTSLALSLFIMFGFFICNTSCSLKASADSVTDPATGIIYDPYSGTINGYKGSNTDLVIPEKINGVTINTIGYQAFYYSKITSITLPDSIKYIDRYAFYCCSLLKNIILPQNLTCIKYQTFDSCSSLESITIPDSVKTIEDSAFASCKNLKSVILPKNITNIENSTFRDCASLSNITIPESVTNIGDEAFLNCKSLSKICIPNAVNQIGKYAFAACKSLTNIEIPKSVISIGAVSFLNCDSLKNIDVNNLNEYYASMDGVLYDKNFENLIAYPTGKTETFTIPNSVTSIGTFAFLGSEIEKINLPDNLKTIDSYSFANCDKLSEIELPESVTYIGKETFYNCTSLRKIIIPKNVSTIISDAFEGCSSLRIFGYKNSYAESYAQKYNIAFRTIIEILINPYIKTPTNKDITVTATADSGTLNESSHTFTENGTFNFIATDDEGNSYYKAVTITNIDKKAPIITINPYNNSMPTNQDITVTAQTDKGTLNVTSHTFTENGSFDFIAIDEAGNQTTKTITISNIDKVPPVITGVEDNKTYVTPQDVTFNKGTATLNGQDFVKGRTISENGDYTLIVKDEAGNETIVHFRICIKPLNFNINGAEVGMIPNGSSDPKEMPVIHVSIPIVNNNIKPSDIKASDGEIALFTEQEMKEQSKVSDLGYILKDTSTLYLKNTKKDGSSVYYILIINRVDPSSSYSIIADKKFKLSDSKQMATVTVDRKTAVKLTEPKLMVVYRYEDGNVTYQTLDLPISDTIASTNIFVNSYIKSVSTCLINGDLDWSKGIPILQSDFVDILNF